MSVSILMPLYSGIHLLEESVNSVLQQTHTNWELLVGINGHHSETANYVKSILYKYNDDRIRFFELKEKGKSKTLNFLKERSSFDLIALLDVDDLWENSKLEKQISLASVYDVIGSDAKYFGDQDGSPNIFLGKITEEMFSFQNPIINSSVLMKKNFLHWNEEYEGIDDYALWITLMKSGCKFYNVPEILTYHRLHNRSYFNGSNLSLSQKIRDEKLIKLSDREKDFMTGIIVNKRWQL